MVNWSILSIVVRNVEKTRYESLQDIFDQYNKCTNLLKEENKQTDYSYSWLP